MWELEVWVSAMAWDWMWMILMWKMMMASCGFP